MTAEGTPPAGGEDATTPVPDRTVGGSWRTLGRALAPRATKAQLAVGLLAVLLGFALVVQVQQNRDEGLATLRQDELVRILDEVTQRGEELESEVATLRAQRAELVTGTDTELAAREAAQERARVQGILAGRLPAVGPGVHITLGVTERPIPPLTLYNVLEELRNAGAEAVQVNDVRLTASSYFVEGPERVVLADGRTIEPPYRWRAIGDPSTMASALQIPGGAMAQVRGVGGTTTVTEMEEVEVTATREPVTPQFATPVPPPEG
ncbi:membrane protein [Actinotalea ferrariae CF5-4]|uniref:Membrane protein n=1 Tax=Actinotalea ferrariae CF5-4 TaxID=948458 RepID=A0A021VSG7_9CELL|nr:DUF881 domain-containing protein [Actinotalea ferrariae]EYR64144.1 membrane protein [Actinotalea ferrariae CF5-4]